MEFEIKNSSLFHPQRLGLKGQFCHIDIGPAQLPGKPYFLPSFDIAGVVIVVYFDDTGKCIITCARQVRYQRQAEVLLIEFEDRGHLPRKPIPDHIMYLLSFGQH